MPKGRTYAPSIENDGNWFRTRGFKSAPLFRDTSTSTGRMLAATFNVESLRRPASPPPTFKNWSRVNYKDENNFSLHDNRHTFQDFGVYFGHGLGKRLVPPEERQHRSEDLVAWQKKDFYGTTNYNYSYQLRHCRSPPKRRRFPTIHQESKPGLIELDTTTNKWFTAPDVPYETRTHVLATSQEPFLQHNPWKYSYRAHTARFV